MVVFYGRIDRPIPGQFYSRLFVIDLEQFTKSFTMDNQQKLLALNKILRQLDDISNSSTSLLKKIAQAEVENINLGNKIIDEKIPDLYFKMDAILSDTAALVVEFTEFRDAFIVDNKLGEGSQAAA